MSIKVFLYAICLLASTFAVSGLKINGLFKQNYVNEARVFNILIIISMAYLSTNLIYDLLSMITNV